ncbi:MAG: MFS transporter [Euryarchaeota archaeon]|nr:MFS transporter [Euryarchaeota archaeon]
MEYQVYKYRWAVVALFWTVIFAYGANWFALSPMLKTFEEQFAVPAWEGHLLISLIGIFVVFFAWPAGTLIDKKGPKLSITIGALFMALGFGIRPWLLDSFASLLLSSVIAGIGLAWILVAMGPQMLRWFPKKQASLPVGIAASGLFIGFGTGSLLMPIINAATSQTNGQTGFLIFGVIAILSFILWVILAKDSPKTPPEEQIKVEPMKFVAGMKKVFTSKNAFLYPIVGFLIVGITLVISSFIHSLYSTTAVIKEQGGYIAGLLLYGCAIGAFTAPFIMKKIGLKKITLAAVSGAIVLWLVLFGLFAMNSYDVTSISWIVTALVAFLFGVCFQASWPLALYSQETEDGVTGANVGISASLYISVSNIGAAVLPVIFPILFVTSLANFIAIFAGLVVCLLIWAIVKRK